MGLGPPAGSGQRPGAAPGLGGGAGPGALPYTIDVDSTICEVYGARKQGAAFGHTKVRGYHPLLAFGAGTGDLLGARLRGGNANSGRGAASFVTETINRIRAAGATGQLTLRADSGFYAHPVVKACQRAGVRYSITARLTKAVRRAIQQIPDDGWTPIGYWLDGGADVAETRYRPFGKRGPDVRLIVRRVRPTPGSQLALDVVFDYRFPPAPRSAPTEARPFGPARAFDEGWRAWVGGRRTASGHAGPLDRVTSQPAWPSPPLMTRSEHPGQRLADRTMRMAGCRLCGLGAF